LPACRSGGNETLHDTRPPGIDEERCTEGGRGMEQPISQSPGSNPPWLIRRQGRIVATVVIVAVAYLLTRGLPDELNLLIPYNTGVGVYLVLTGALMRRASPEDAAELSRCGEPNNILTLIVVIALSVFSLVGVAAMLNQPSGRPRWVVNLHMTTSLLAVILSWFLAHIYFGLHYMRLYYDDAIVGGKLTYHKGLPFPNVRRPISGISCITLLRLPCAIRPLMSPSPR
jgi:uncharacterized membrane protein